MTPSVAWDASTMPYQNNGPQAGDYLQDEPAAVTVLECAKARGLKGEATDHGSTSYSAADFAAVGFELMGGCASCEACIAAYNAYPSVSGFWLCADCVGDRGFPTVQAFENWADKQRALDLAERIIERQRARRERARYEREAEAERKAWKGERCDDCGAIGERTGHQACQYPKDHR